MSVGPADFLAGGFLSCSPRAEPRGAPSVRGSARHIRRATLRKDMGRTSSPIRIAPSGIPPPGRRPLLRILDRLDARGPIVFSGIPQMQWNYGPDEITQLSVRRLVK